MMFIENSAISIDVHGMLKDIHWFPLKFYWCSLLFIGCSMNVHWILLNSHWFPLMFKENGASVGRPSAAFGPLGVGVKRWKISVSRGAPPKTGPVSQPPPQPSAPIRSLRRPSAPAGWELSVGTGLPPQTPPDFLLAYTRLMLWVLFIALTRRRSRWILIRLILINIKLIFNLIKPY